MRGASVRNDRDCEHPCNHEAYDEPQTSVLNLIHKSASSGTFSDKHNIASICALSGRQEGCDTLL